MRDALSPDKHGPVKHGPPLLDVRGLTTRFYLDEGVVHAVEELSFDVRPGQRFGLVGESGSGKTVTALSILGLIDPPGRIEAGAVLFRGRDLRAIKEDEYRRVRGGEIGMIFQDPLATLNPVLTVGAQLVEVVRAHQPSPRKVARSRAVQLLADVGIPAPRERADDYPHQFSGGMRQRVGIALALAADPCLLIADEPTTALDVTIQAQIMELVQELVRDRNMAVILITHDLAVVAGFCDVIGVMYAGRLVERADRATLFERPAHPYARSLLESVTRIDRPASGTKRVRMIPGLPPSLLGEQPGCAFEPRCFLCGGRERCRHETPVLKPTGGHDHVVACHYADELKPAHR